MQKETRDGVREGLLRKYQDEDVVVECGTKLFVHFFFSTFW